MTITITLDDELTAGLENRAKQERLTVEQFARSILAEAIGKSDELSLQALVERIRATPPNPSQIRPATGNLAEALRAVADDPSFDLETWKRDWSAIEAEMKAVTRANDIAEGRGG
jgi:hypothetical protein